MLWAAAAGSDRAGGSLCCGSVLAWGGGFETAAGFFGVSASKLVFRTATGSFFVDTKPSCNETCNIDCVRLFFCCYITIACLYNVYPFIPHWVYSGIAIFLIFDQKHRWWVLVKASSCVPTIL